MTAPLEEGVDTILTLDNDFEDVAGVTGAIVLSAEEVATLHEYIEADR